MGKVHRNGTQVFMYIVQHGDTDFYKLGYSANPLQRLTAMQIDNPIDLKIIALVSTTTARATERLIHKFVKNFHHKGEWFRLDSDTLMKLFTEFGFTAELIVVPDKSVSIHSKTNTFLRSA